MSVAGCTIMIEHIDKGDELMKTKKTDNESEREKEIDVTEQEVDVEGHGKQQMNQEMKLPMIVNQRTNHPWWSLKTQCMNYRKPMRWNLSMKALLWCLD